MMTYEETVKYLAENYVGIQEYKRCKAYSTFMNELRSQMGMAAIIYKKSFAEVERDVFDAALN